MFGGSHSQKGPCLGNRQEASTLGKDQGEVMVLMVIEQVSGTTSSTTLAAEQQGHGGGDPRQQAQSQSMSAHTRQKTKPSYAPHNAEDNHGISFNSSGKPLKSHRAEKKT